MRWDNYFHKIKTGGAHKNKTATASDSDWRVEDHVIAQKSLVG